MTVCRRYHELHNNLDYLWAHAHEFAARPVVVVVWARPEVGRLWFFQELLRKQSIHHVMGRPALPGEADGLPTSHPESINIRKGLDFIHAFYPQAPYVLMQAADVCPREGTYRFVDGQMTGGAKAILFHWENGSHTRGVWHTNFFAVCLDESYWPPFSAKGEPDVLERQWGRILEKRNLPAITQSHNYQQKRFVHAHESEGLPPFEAKPQQESQILGLCITGRKSLWQRFLGFLGVLTFWRQKWRK